MKNILLVLSCLITTAAFAQKTIEQQIKDDPNIDWAIKTKFAYVLQKYDKREFKALAELNDMPKMDQILQMVKDDTNQDCASGELITDYLNFGLANDRLLTYEGTKKLSWGEIVEKYGGIDTIITFDPKTYEEKIKILKNDAIAYSSNFLIEQVWYHDRKAQKIKVMALAIWPIVHGKPYFKIPLKADLNADFNINSPSIPWAIRSINSLNFENGKLIKGKDRTAFKAVFYDAPKKGEQEIYVKRWNCLQSLPATELDKFVSASIDTLITFDPRTEIEEIIVKENPGLNFEQLNHFKVNQIWYFDEKTGILTSEIQQMGVYQKMDIKNPSPIFVLQYWMKM